MMTTADELKNMPDYGYSHKYQKKSVDKLIQYYLFPKNPQAYGRPNCRGKAQEHLYKGTGYERGSIWDGVIIRASEVVLSDLRGGRTEVEPKYDTQYQTYNLHGHGKVSFPFFRVIL